MKSLCLALPVACLATAVTLSVGQQVRDPFAVSPERCEEIKAAMPEATPAPFNSKQEVHVFTKTVGFRHEPTFAWHP
ncbi:MAG: hypothetical protein ACKV19_19590 [Verrucomicrobiales bacterium]